MSPPSPVETTSTGLSRLPETALSRSRRTPESSKGNATRLQARKMSLARRRVTSALRRRPTAAAACFSSSFNDRYASAASKSWAATSSSHCKPSDSLPGGLEHFTFFVLSFAIYPLLLGLLEYGPRGADLRFRRGSYPRLRTKVCRCRIAFRSVGQQAGSRFRRRTYANQTGELGPDVPCAQGYPHLRV